jgi:hypothetical protein
MSLQNFAFEFAYTEAELKKLRFYSKTFSTTLIVFYLVITVFTQMLNVLNSVSNIKTVILPIYIPFMVAIIVLFIIMILKAPIIRSLRGTQKLYFADGNLVFESENQNFKIETKYILKIQEKPDFYQIRLVTMRPTEGSKNLATVFPLIPRRAATQEQMKAIADSLQIKFKPIG